MHLPLTVGVNDNRCVEAWQSFLDTNGYGCPPDGDFGPRTLKCTQTFQKNHPECGRTDGVVDQATIDVAMKFDFVPTTEGTTAPSGVPTNITVPAPFVAPTKPTGAFPALPPFGQLGGTKRAQLLGSYSWTPYPATNSSGQSITISGSWEKDNIVKVFVPQLVNLPWYSPYNAERCNGNIRLHKVVVPSFLGLMQAVEDEGCLGDLLSVDGAFFARYIRNSTTSLSNHAYGSAVDFNSDYNGMGNTPAKSGQRGCMYRVATIAQRFGWYWGGHFSRRDGMHLEFAAVV